MSETKYALNGNYSKFVSYVNIQYGAGGTVAYEVWADGTRLFDSGPMNGGSYTKAVNADVSGKQELKLVVTDAGDGNGADWVAWADARLIPNNTPLPTATPTPTYVPTATPTSVLPTSIPTPTPTLFPPTPTSPPLPTSTIAPSSTALSLNLFLHGIGKGGG